MSTAAGVKITGLTRFGRQSKRAERRGHDDFEGSGARVHDSHLARTPGMRLW